MKGQPAADPSLAPFFVEEVRKYLERTYGAKKLYEQGLAVETSLDLPLQQAANAAIDAGLRRLDKRRGFRKPKRNVVAEGHSPEAFTIDRWARPMRVGDVVPAVVLGPATPAPPGARAAAGTIRLRMGAYTAELPKAGYAWTRKTAPAFLRAGDLVDVRIAALDEHGGSCDRRISSRRRLVEGALLAIDNHTGQVRAMVGRLQLRAQQVQPRGAGLPAAGLHVQADRLHRRHRSRLHARLRC